MPQITSLTPAFGVADTLTPGDFASIAAQGYKAVISVRPDGEAPDQLTAKQEAALAWRNGLTFRHVPAGKLDLFADPVVEGMEEALRNLNGPVLAHCQSGIRAAIVWAAASARSQTVDCVIDTLTKAGFDLDFIRDDLDAQADRRRWLGTTSPALDCGCPEPAVLKPRAAVA
jgi:sulfide:quinone oxidoreductase